MQSIANNFSSIAAVVPWFLDAVSLTHRVVGPKPLEWVSSKLNVLSRNYIPEWNPYMPAVSPLLMPALLLTLYVVAQLHLWQSVH